MNAQLHHQPPSPPPCSHSCSRGGRWAWAARAGTLRVTALPGDKISGRAPQLFRNTRLSTLSTCCKVDFSPPRGAPQRRHAHNDHKTKRRCQSVKLAPGSENPVWRPRGPPPLAPGLLPPHSWASSPLPASVHSACIPCIAVIPLCLEQAAGAAAALKMLSETGGRLEGRGAPLSPLPTVHRGEFGPSAGRPAVPTRP